VLLIGTTLACAGIAMAFAALLGIYAEQRAEVVRTGATWLPKDVVIDLTPFFCSSKQCFPVVGGVLVHKDQDHLTQNFSRTLGPYIGRAVDRAG
jgi:hypothetical protein